MLDDLYSQISLEAKAEIELEKVWFGKIADMNQLKKAKEVIYIEQWEIKTKGSLLRADCVRVRNYNNKKYELTVKKDLGSKDGKGMLEKNFPIDKEGFEIFKQIAVYGFIKERFVFPIDDQIKWELDVHHDKHGKRIDWCKVDLELPASYLNGRNINDVTIKSPFPVAFDEVFYRREATAIQSNFVNIELYRNRYTIWNPMSILPIEDGKD